MYNKLSFIPFESLYPFRLSLDDFEDDGLPVVPKKDPIGNIDAIAVWADLKAMFEGSTIRKSYLDGLKTKLKSWVKGDIKKMDEDTLFYILRIIASGEGAGLSNLKGEIPNDKKELWEKKNVHFWMLSLLKKIPINYIDDYHEKLAVFNPDSPSTDALGFYVSSDEKNDNRASIYLCLTRIREAADACKIPYKVLYAKVLIHELAHAMMDPTNKLKNLGTPKESEQPKMSPKDSAMEESLANMITLQYFKVAKEKGVIEEAEFTKVRDFMQKQPAEYKFGIAQEEIIKPDWRSWRDNKATIKFWMKWGAKVQHYLSKLEKDNHDFFNVK